MPGGTVRNFDSYGEKLAPLTQQQRDLLCDPQTSGGLLIAVAPAAQTELETLLSNAGLYAQAIGELVDDSTVFENNADYLVEVV